jgi:hypothetical protein
MKWSLGEREKRDLGLEGKRKKGVRLPTSLFSYRKRPPQQDGDVRKGDIVQD